MGSSAPAPLVSLPSIEKKKLKIKNKKNLCIILQKVSGAEVPVGQKRGTQKRIP
jgi:hypothetical protein